MSDPHPAPAAPLAVATVAAYTTAREDLAALVPANARAILDVGCSNGELGAALRARLPGRAAWGIERDPTLAAQAAARLDRVLHADLDGFEWRPELAGQRFDCIIFGDVLEHLVAPERHLAEAVEHLCPGGRVVVSLPNIRHVSALAAIFLRGRFPRRERGLFDRTHLHWYTLTDAHALLQDAGLEIVAETLALRFGDRGGGRANRWLNRLPHWAQRLPPVRELLTYQVALAARVQGA